MSSRACLGAVAAALALAGCSGPAPASGEVSARFVTARDDQVIEVSLVGSRAIAAADLVFPDGTREPAYSIDAQRDPELTPPPDTPGAGKPSVNTGSTSLTGQIASLALIRVSHPADYAQAWQQARIAIRLGFGRDVSSELIAAPPPPTTGAAPVEPPA
ncbi:MAG TPA: hypothetical protein VKS60_23655 [Stellaceae bacterium]|nr:hypothetical protein [Stellaceae bacterium]